MKKWLLGACIAFLGGVLFMGDAEAKRLGGGRAVGTQRNVTAPPQQQSAAQQAAPAQKAAQPAPAGNRWAGILGGLALGGLIGYLFGGSGLMGSLMGILLIAALAFGAVVLVRALMQKRSPQPMQLAAAGNTNFSVPEPIASSGAVAATGVPAGFDVAGFLRGAKMNFVKLQLANDRAEIDEVLEFTTPELFQQLKADGLVSEGRQETDISGLEAELLDLATENGQYWASVRFSGMEREATGTAPAHFQEVWNLVKPVDGSSGWLLAGIQQMH